MLHATPSVGLAKFLWSKPAKSNPPAMTVSATGEGGTEVAKPIPMTISASDSNVAGQGHNMSGVMMNSSEGKCNAFNVQCKSKRHCQLWLLSLMLSWQRVACKSVMPGANSLILVPHNSTHNARAHT